MSGIDSATYKFPLNGGDEALANGLNLLYENLKSNIDVAQRIANDPENTIQDKVAIMLRFLGTVHEMSTMNIMALMDIVRGRAQEEREERDT